MSRRSGHQAVDPHSKRQKEKWHFFSPHIRANFWAHLILAEHVGDHFGAGPHTSVKSLRHFATRQDIAGTKNQAANGIGSRWGFRQKPYRHTKGWGANLGTANEPSLPPLFDRSRSWTALFKPSDNIELCPVPSTSRLRINVRG